MECLTLTDSILKQSGRAIVFIHTFDVVGYCSVGPKGPTWEMTDADTLLLVFLRSAQWQPKDIIVESCCWGEFQERKDYDLCDCTVSRTDGKKV